MSELTKDILQALSEPFDASEEKSRQGRGSTTFTYINARAVMDRLDEVVGPGAWSTEFDVIRHDPPAVECRLTVCGVTKADCGEADAEDEPLKSAYSDAFKRAAVHFGIARYLYRSPQQQQARQAQQRPAAPPRSTEGNRSSQAQDPRQATATFIAFCRSIWPKADNAELEREMRQAFEVPNGQKIGDWMQQVGAPQAMARAKARAEPRNRETANTNKELQDVIG